MAARIVVGVDGSDTSREALAAAFEQARLRDASLDVVVVQDEPLVAALEAIGIPVPQMPEHSGEALGERVLDTLLADAPDHVELRRLVRRGHPAEVLIDVAEGAELLVIGSRGLGGFRGMLLGSTSQQVLHHASCPVLVVPVAEDA